MRPAPRTTVRVRSCGGSASCASGSRPPLRSRKTFFTVPRPADADKVYHAAADVIDKLCADFPQSALFHNNRAWLAARCRRDLPQAIEHAQKAVTLIPASASFQETLAETRFQITTSAASIRPASPA